MKHPEEKSSLQSKICHAFFFFKSTFLYTNFPSVEVVDSLYQFLPQWRQQSPEVSIRWGRDRDSWAPREGELPSGAGESRAGPGRLGIAVFTRGLGQDFQLNSSSPSCKTLQKRIYTSCLAWRLRESRKGFWHWVLGMCSSFTLHRPGAREPEHCLSSSVCDCPHKQAHKQGFTHPGGCEKRGGRKLSALLLLWDFLCC